jgi:hypothetical protein
MSNPGVDLAIWERLKKTWAELEANGHHIAIEFKLIVTGEDKEKTMAIDVIQKIDDQILTETVQHIEGEAYETLGIADLSMERLEEVYKEKLSQLYRQSNVPHAKLVVTMTPRSPVSGEVKAYLEEPKKNQKSSILVDYQHYYLLNALRDKMIETVGDGWRQVKAVYWQDTLEFYFEY